MPVSLVAMREALWGGVALWSHMTEPLSLADVPADMVHLRRVFAKIPVTTVRDLVTLPDLIDVDGKRYERALVFAGREYPQGWGRGPGGAAAEPPPEPDGKVDTFKSVDNANMKALRAEVDRFLERYRR